jgi:hypothetical protein
MMSETPLFSAPYSPPAIRSDEIGDAVRQLVADDVRPPARKF